MGQDGASGMPRHKLPCLIDCLEMSSRGVLPVNMLAGIISPTDWRGQARQQQEEQQCKRMVLATASMLSSRPLGCATICSNCIPPACEAAVITARPACCIVNRGG